MAYPEVGRGHHGGESEREFPNTFTYAHTKILIVSSLLHISATYRVHTLLLEHTFDELNGLKSLSTPRTRKRTEKNNIYRMIKEQRRSITSLCDYS